MGVSPILIEYRALFEVPKEQPPKWSHDHRVPLKPGVEPFKVPPYRYSYLQKREIEKLVTEMLQAGLIQASGSPYSSPVLLIKKKDGTWKFCVDCRRLSSMTINDSFPISLIDELLDELGQAKVF